MKYTIQWTDKRGKNRSQWTTNFQELLIRMRSLTKQRIEAVVYQNNQIVGRVWKDNSQRIAWNYSIETS